MMPSSNFMTAFEDIDHILDLAGKKADQKVSKDLSNIEFDTDELINAIINVNSRLFLRYLI